MDAFNRKIKKKHLSLGNKEETAKNFVLRKFWSYFLQSTLLGNFFAAPSEHSVQMVGHSVHLDILSIWTFCPNGHLDILPKWLLRHCLTRQACDSDVINMTRVQPRRHGGALMGLAPRNKAPSPPNDI